MRQAMWGRPLLSILPSITYRSKAATKKSLTTKGTKNTEHKGHKEKRNRS